MNTLEIVLLSILSGLFIALLIVSNGYLAWMLHSTRRVLASTQASADATTRELDLLKSSISTILESHRQELNKVVSKINGEKIAEAAQIILQSASRIEKACVAFGEFGQEILGEEFREEAGVRRAARAGLGAEEYAPNPTGETFVSQSRTGVADSQELSGEGEETIPGI